MKVPRFSGLASHVPTAMILVSSFTALVGTQACRHRNFHSRSLENNSSVSFEKVAWDIAPPKADFASDQRMIENPGETHLLLLERLGQAGSYSFAMPEFIQHAKFMSTVVDLQRESIEKGLFLVDDSIGKSMGFEGTFSQLQNDVTAKLAKSVREPPAYLDFMKLSADWSLLITRAAWSKKSGREEIRLLRFDPFESWRKAHRAIAALPEWKTVFFWPLFLNLSLKDLLMTASSEVYPVGVTAKQDLFFDGRKDAPIGFLAHDMIHSRKMKESDTRVKESIGNPADGSKAELVAYHARWKAFYAPRVTEMLKILDEAAKKPSPGVNGKTASAILFTFLHELHKLDTGCRIVPEGEKALPWTYWSLGEFEELIPGPENGAAQVLQ